MKNLLICTVIALGLSACIARQSPMPAAEVKAIEASCKGKPTYNYGWRDGKMYVLDVYCTF